MFNTECCNEEKDQTTQVQLVGEVMCKQYFPDEKPVVPGNRRTESQLNVWSTVFSLLAAFVYHSALEVILMPFKRLFLKP